MLSLITLTTKNEANRNYFLPLEEDSINAIVKGYEAIVANSKTYQTKIEPTIITTSNLFPPLKAQIKTANFFIFTQKESFKKMKNTRYIGEIPISTINNAIISDDEYLVILDCELYKTLIPYSMKIYEIKVDSTFKGTTDFIVPNFSKLNFSTEQRTLNDINMQIHKCLFSKSICNIKKLFSAYSDTSCFLSCNMKCKYY